ncbi:hypothetical protein [Kineococcus gynurae]|uniref:Uncharacterized protein n=1 Tax=Kineococcus gynurae TaxID=452979 RepID=A0ABV5LUI6_9ACTN
MLAAPHRDGDPLATAGVAGALVVPEDCTFVGGVRQRAGDDIADHLAECGTPAAAE